MFSIITHIDPARIPGRGSRAHSVSSLPLPFGALLRGHSGWNSSPARAWGVGCLGGGAPTGLQGRQNSHCTHSKPTWVLQKGPAGLPGDLKAPGTASAARSWPRQRPTESVPRPASHGQQGGLRWPGVRASLNRRGAPAEC